MYVQFSALIYISHNRLNTPIQRGQCICFLSSLPLLLPATAAGVWVLRFISLLTTTTVYHRCGLAFPHDWRGFVGAKKKTIVELFVLNPLCSQPPITYTIHCGLIPACMCMNQFKENRLSKLRRHKWEQAVVQFVPIRPTIFLENASMSVCVFVLQNAFYTYGTIKESIVTLILSRKYIPL